MNDNGTAPDPARTVELVADRKLVIERQGETNVLRILASDGKAAVSIRVTAEGTELEIGGSALAVRTRGELSIDAGRVSLHGREGVALSSGGDVDLHAEGEVRSSARAQKITARLGDVDVYANDDVKMDGERIRMNC